MRTGGGDDVKRITPAVIAGFKGVLTAKEKKDLYKQVVLTYAAVGLAEARLKKLIVRLNELGVGDL